MLGDPSSRILEEGVILAKWIGPFPSTKNFGPKGKKGIPVPHLKKKDGLEYPPRFTGPTGEDTDWQMTSPASLKPARRERPAAPADQAALVCPHCFFCFHGLDLDSPSAGGKAWPKRKDE